MGEREPLRMRIYTLRKTTALTVGLALALAVLLGLLIMFGNKPAGAEGPLEITDPGQLSGDQVPIDLVQGNPSCSDLGNYRSIKDDGDPITGQVPEGTFPSADGYLSATVSNIHTIPGVGQVFDWSSTGGIDKVIAKGGDAADAYVYTPEDNADTSLHAPVNPNNADGTYFGLSHIDFCYDVEAQVSKTADTSFTRTYKWKITKSANPTTVNLSPGGTGSSSYTIVVDKNGYEDSAWKVSGKITVTNPLNDQSITINSINDVLSPSNATPSATNCKSGGNDITLPYTLAPQPAPNASLVCDYSASLTSGTNGTNTATAVSGTQGIGDGVGKADFTFGDPTTEKDKSVKVNDSFSGGPQNQSVSLSDAPKPFTYSRTFKYSDYSTCGDQTEKNTATLYGDNNAVLDSAEASVIAHVLCKAKLVKTVNGAAPSGSQSFTFQLRQGASGSSAGTTLETGTANAANGGIINFTTGLQPNSTYQLCETVMPGWLTTLGPPFFTVFNPSGDNSTVCTDFKVDAPPGSTKTFNIDNKPPPGGFARTIGFWKNWASCANSNGKQKPVLDQTLAAASATGGVTIGTLTLNATDCSKAVSLLSKQNINTGKSMSSDEAFNLAAQLLAAKLDVVAGAGTCPAAVTAINNAQALLAAIQFNGATHNTMTAAQKTQANSLATTLDAYNNNKLC
jgi:hypothetical protein